MKKFITLKADLTLRDGSKQLLEKYQIKGIPTVIFLKPGGEEVKQLRLVGFENAEKFFQRMKQMETIISLDVSQ